MLLKNVDHFTTRMYPNRFGENRKKVVNEKWKSGDMVKMCVRQHNVPNRSSFSFADRVREASSVDRYAFIDQNARIMLPISGRSVLVERAWK